MASGETNRLGFEDEEPADLTKDQWLRAQRDLVTTTLDYNLQAIARLVQDRRIDLSPTFQRRDRWDAARRSRLIESFMMNVPMPPVFLNEDEYGEYSVIDGKQRLTTVAEFLDNRFALSNLTIFQEANGSFFRDLDPSLQSVLETRASLRAIIILRMSDPLIKYHVFQRLNTGGVHLNAQEVRNVVFTGSLNDEMLLLSQDEDYQRLLRIDPKKPATSAVWREMRDVELILRFFTLREERAYHGSLGGAMNAFMEQNYNANKQRVRELRKTFLATIERTSVAFGELAFRRWSPRSGKWGNQILATLFDAQMLACEGLPPDSLEGAAARIQDGMRELFDNQDFVRSIGSATNTAAFVRHRVEAVRGLVESVIL